MSIQLEATALLRLAGPKIEQARVRVRGHSRVARYFGEKTARWAYADRGDTPGHRHESEADIALKAWEPSIDDWCIVLYGATGCGKTISAARYVAEREGLLITATAADTWGFGGGEGLREARGATWLLVDDFGDEKTEVGTANLATLLGDRDAAGAYTVCTTTLSPEELAARGDHLASRLRPFVVVLLDDTDKRSKTPPFLRGIGRARQTVALARRVDGVASGYLDGKEAIESMTALARLVRVDLGSKDFAVAVATERKRIAEMEELLGEVLARLTEIGAAMAPPTDDDVSAWLDSIEVDDDEIAAAMEVDA